MLSVEPTSGPEDDDHGEVRQAERLERASSGGLSRHRRPAGKTEAGDPLDRAFRPLARCAYPP
jgi:hypothetical protein